MRVTNRMMVDNAIKHMQENLDRLNDIQTKVATGKAFQNPSEDPIAAAEALGLRSSLKQNAVFQEAASSADDWMSANEMVFQKSIDLGMRALTLAEEGLSDTVGPDERLAMAEQMEQLLQSGIELANTKHGNNYIFGGFRTDIAPFSQTDPNTVAYNGDAGVIQRSVGPNQLVTVNVDGDGTFSPFLAAMIEARNALNADDGPALQAALGNLQTAMDGLKDVQASNGARQKEVQRTGERLVDMAFQLESLLSDKEDVRMTEAISELQHQEIVYQNVLQVARRAISALSLFDFLNN